MDFTIFLLRFSNSVAFVRITTYLFTFKTKMLYYTMLCCSTSVLQTSQPATNQTYRSLHCCWRIYVMTPCIQWKDFLPRLLLVSVSGGTVYAQSGQEIWKTVLCAMWNQHRNWVVCHLCHNFDNLVHCTLLSEPRE